MAMTEMIGLALIILSVLGLTLTITDKSYRRSENFWLMLGALFFGVMIGLALFTGAIA